MPIEELDLRENLSSEQRALPLEHTIDPGFVHHRKLPSVPGETKLTTPIRPERFRRHTERDAPTAVARECPLKR